MKQQPIVLLKEDQVIVPANTIPEERSRFIHTYLTITKGTNRLMLMAGDQKIEHLNEDFYGSGISPDDADPEHLFRIASQGTIGCFATQHGLIAQYGSSYPTIPYVVKMNSRTNIVDIKQAEPQSRALVTFQDVLDLRKNGNLHIVGIGYTVYFGSEYETEMLQEAGSLIAQAHKYGMIAVIWGYPRGKAITNEKDAHLIAGAAGVTACLGADFVKVMLPDTGVANLPEAVLAAGRTGVIISGGEEGSAKDFLQQTYDTIHIGNARGSATGRNVHQRPLAEAVAMTKALSAIVYKNATVEEAYQLFNQYE
ncbi:MAG TPA: aldolase [Patescibacteria group bacterium]|nr:aldolase [Patescibacteria group bacterium]